MDVIGIVTATLVSRCAHIRVGFRNLEHVLNDGSVSVDMMQVTVMQVIDVVSMGDTGVFAVGTVLMVVIGMYVWHFWYSGLGFGKRNMKEESGVG